MFVKNQFGFTFKVNQHINISLLQNCEIITNAFMYSVIENNYCLGEETTDLSNYSVEEFISNYC